MRRGKAVCRRGLAPVGRAWRLWAGLEAGGGGSRVSDSGRGVPGLGRGPAPADCPQDSLVSNCDVTYWPLWSPPISDIPAGHVWNPPQTITPAPPGAPTKPLASHLYNLSPAGGAWPAAGPAAGRSLPSAPLSSQACWPLLTVRPLCLQCGYIWDPAEGGLGTPRLPVREMVCQGLFLAEPTDCLGGARLR